VSERRTKKQDYSHHGKALRCYINDFSLGTFGDSEDPQATNITWYRRTS